MSRTFSHGKNIIKKYKELFKNKSFGYEYWSKRPYSNNHGCLPGKFSKWMTKRKERKFNKKGNYYEFY